MRTETTISLASVFLATLFGGAASAQSKDFLIDDVVGALEWRSLGPARFGGRVVDIAVHPERSRTFYVATGSGGLFKTENNGINFTPSFQYESVISIGDVAIAPGKPDVVYVGTGEANNQRSSYWGKGVYKSVDAGKNWKNVGLKGTDHIGRVVVHPKNPDIVYVAALGALYRKNEERGVYRSIDGGGSWVKVKYISEDVGFVDIAMDPNEPKTLYAASYERRRRAWDFDGNGPGSGIWKSTDSGDTWTKLTGGLPTGEIGRIGLDVYDGKDGTVVFACVENGNPRQAGGDQQPSQGRSRRGRSRTVGGEVYRSADNGKTWKKINENPVGGSPGYYYGQIRVDPTDEKRIYLLGVPVTVTTDGGKTWRTDGARGVHVDHHALWINPKNPRHLRLGNDGGMHTSYDYGKTWDHMNHLSMGQFYAVTADLSDPYWVYGGTQDNGTWGVPIRSERGAVQNRHAAKVGGGDGFFVQVDPMDPAILYSESQFGGVSRQNLRTGERKGIKPRAERGSPRLRFNWCSPIKLSPHNHHTVFFGSQYLHKSTNRGDKWMTISPDLTTADENKLKGNVPHCTITSISESPKTEGLIWVGTDDGKVWVTRNGGERWTDLTERFAGTMPRNLWVSRVEASPSDEKVAYVSFTGYREDIRDPFLYITIDGGETFRSISNDLPQEPINVIREHPRNKDVLFVGTEFGVFVSLNGGGNWVTMQGDMPTVACHDLLVHPREKDLIVGTHGRGFYVMDIAPLEELNATVLASDFHVFPATDGLTSRRGFDQGYIGNRTWSADAHGGSPVFSYYLRQDTSEPVVLRVLDAKGSSLFTNRGPTKAGLHRVTWGGGRGRGGRGGGRGGFGGIARRLGGGGVRPGNFVLEVTHGDTVVRRVFKVTGVATPAGGGRRGEDEEPEEQRKRVVR